MTATTPATPYQSDFEVIAKQDWPLKNISKGDIVHFKRGTEPKEGDIVATGNPLESSNKCEIHVFNFLTKGVLGVCVAVTRTVKSKDRTRHRFGPPDVHKAIQNLWEIGADQLDNEALEWFEDFNTAAQERCEELSKTLLNMGCTIMNDERSGCFMQETNVADLLFVVREQVITITAMIEVSGNATHRLRNPESYKRGAA